MEQNTSALKSKWPNRIFFLVLGLLILGSVAFTYYRIIVKKDYLISAEADCDPTTEKCFVYVCDPAAGEECTGNPEEDTSYYKIIKRKAFNIPPCDPNDENCEALTCPEGEADCSYELCEEGNTEGIECNDPEQYNIDHPADEETACEEGDEECALDSESACEEGDTECLEQEQSDENSQSCDPEQEDCSGESSSSESSATSEE